MKNSKTIAVIALFTGIASAQVEVKPYVLQSGSVVQGHQRSSPNDSRLDNYSTHGNTNPVTGQNGYMEPYKPLNQSIYSPPMYGPKRCGYINTGEYICKK